MNCAIPYWLLMLQGLLTPVIAILTVTIAFFQWRIGYQKMVIDLFDRRMKVYTDCRDILQPIVVSPRATTHQNGIEFIRASADAEFLFGDKVVEYLEKVEQAIFDLVASEAELKGDLSDQDRKESTAKSRAAIEVIKSFYKNEFRSRLRPYMQLKQRSGWRTILLR